MIPFTISQRLRVMGSLQDIAEDSSKRGSSASSVARSSSVIRKVFVVIACVVCVWPDGNFTVTGFRNHLRPFAVFVLGFDGKHHEGIQVSPKFLGRGSFYFQSDLGRLHRFRGFGSVGMFGSGPISWVIRAWIFPDLLECPRCQHLHHGQG
jgi:hypothetical protein